MEINVSEVQQICNSLAIEVKDLKSITGSFDKKIFLINQEYLLRVSESSMTHEQEKFGRVAGLEFVPKVKNTGTLNRKTGPIYYTLLTLLPGDDFVNVFSGTSESQQEYLGEEVARFLDHLHELVGTHYDIGLYIPAIPHFNGTWREGHQKYWESLYQELQNCPLQPSSLQICASAFRFLQETSPALDFQMGPILLHNDFHPKNILLNEGRFSGVIDWECSQFGEADFELCHLIHWCLYPPESGIDFRPFLRALFMSLPKCTRVPHLAQRLTIYQIEHEMQQILWNPIMAEALRLPRLIDWMDGAVEQLLREIIPDKSYPTKFSSAGLSSG